MLLRRGPALHVNSMCRYTPGSPLANGATRASRSLWPKNMRPTLPEYICSLAGPKALNSTAPRYDDPLSRHRLSYLNGGGGSGKTTRAIELFRQRNPLVLTPTHRLAKCGLGASRPDLSQLLPLEWPDRIDARNDGAEVRPSGDHLGRGMHGTPPSSGNLPRLARGSRRPGHLLWRQGAATPIAGEMPHDWLREHANYYEEVVPDHRAKDPLLKALKKESACSLMSSAKRYERRFLVASGGNASLRPGSHLISS